MDNWSETKKECYYDFIEQMLKDGYITKPRKKAEKKQKQMHVWQYDAFMIFWNAGMRKVNKPASQKIFLRLIRFTDQKGANELAKMLEQDIKKRLEVNQLGFDKMHPSTYLNQSRWCDEIPEKEIELLKVPNPNDQHAIDRFIIDYPELPRPAGEKDYFEYAANLRNYIKENKITAR